VSRAPVAGSLRGVAKHLWLLRHGEAVPHGSTSDADRELTPKGERQARNAGRALAKLDLEFDGCYASPRVRARDTARLACEALGVGALEAAAQHVDLVHLDAEELLRAHGDGACILLVGHEPDFSQVVHDFTGGRIDIKKGGVAAVRVSGAVAEQTVLLRPAELDAMAGS